MFGSTATTAGSTVTSSPVMVTVNPPPVGQTTIEIAQPANGATLYTTTPTHVMPSITTAPGFAVLRVNYYADGVQFAYRTKAPFYAHVRFLVAGSYALTVEVIDSGGYKSLSLPVTVTIVDGTPSVVYYHNDTAGSAVAASDQAGNLVWLEAYRPWGERVLGDDAGTKNGIWYAGKPVEDATGLAYLGARWYSAEVGRFYGVDPVSFREAEPKSVNRYAYANNNPYRYVDPDGRAAAAIAVEIAGWFGAGFASGFVVDAAMQLLDTGRVDFQQAMSAGAEAMPLGPFAGMMARTPQGAASTAKGTGSGVDEAFHYTFARYAASIEKQGLRPGTYATPSGNLSPLQAHIDLALSPNRGLPDSIVRVDLAGLRRAGFEIPQATQVGRSSGMPGGGMEMQFPYSIPPQFITVRTP